MLRSTATNRQANHKVRFVLLSGAAALASAFPAFAQETAVSSDEDQPQIIVTGTRQADRSAQQPCCSVALQRNTTEFLAQR